MSLDPVVVDWTSRFGNPFPAAGGRTAGDAVRLFTDWLDGDGPDVVFTCGRPYDRRWIWANLHQLHGRVLSCTCPADQPCHVDVLNERANQHDERKDQHG